MRPALFAVLTVGTMMAAACSKPTPERRAADSEAAALRNLRDRTAIAKEGAEMIPQGRCTIDQIIGSDDPDRHYLACYGFSSPAGDNPRLAEFRAIHGANDDTIAAACADPKFEWTAWPAAADIYCRDLSQRRQAKATQERPRYEAAGRCTAASIRSATDPDWDYLVCYGDSIGYMQRLRLNAFRDHYGPALDRIRSRCKQIEAAIAAAEANRQQASRDTTSPVHFVTEYAIYCTDQVPRSF